MSRVSSSSTHLLLAVVCGLALFQTIAAGGTCTYACCLGAGCDPSFKGTWDVDSCTQCTKSIAADKYSACDTRGNGFVGVSCSSSSSSSTSSGSIIGPVVGGVVVVVCVVLGYRYYKKLSPFASAGGNAGYVQSNTGGYAAPQPVASAYPQQAQPYSSV